MRDVKLVLRGLAAVALAAPSACGGEEADTDAPIPPAKERPQAGALPEKTATQPASPCDWIAAGEVEAVVGKLSGPPHTHEGGCFYPLPLDSISLARRAKTRQVEEALAWAGMKSDWPPMPEDTGGGAPTAGVRALTGPDLLAIAAQLQTATSGVVWRGSFSPYGPPHQSRSRCCALISMPGCQLALSS